MSKPIRLIVEGFARSHSVPVSLVLAIIKAESSFICSAIRYEKGYRYLYEPASFAKPLKITVATETELQKFSYGLVQIMGATAREAGFPGPLPLLLEPAINIQYGIIFLEVLFRRYGNWEDVISSYNQGSPRRCANGNYNNQKYVNTVLTHWRKYDE